MEIIKNYRDILEILYKFFPRMSKAQLKKVTEIEDDYLLTIYLISAYNVFEVTRHMERSYMITNPDALIITAVEVQELLKTVKAYAKDVIIENLYWNGRLVTDWSEFILEWNKEFTENIILTVSK